MPQTLGPAMRNARKAASVTISQEVTAGARVVSSDGEELGNAAEARVDLFRVDTRIAPDFWAAAQLCQLV